VEEECAGLAGLDTPVLVFWAEEGILAGFALNPASRLEGAQGGGLERFSSVQAEAVLFKCRPGEPHPSPLYVPPILRAEMLALLVFAVGGAWRAEETTRRKLTSTAHAWAAKDVASRVNRRRN
jgi:hypothetical protein